MNVYQTKKEDWTNLKRAVLAVPIREAALIRASALVLERHGHQLFGICPFHSDRRVGNFALGGPHNGFKCFACGEFGNIIDLVMVLDGLSFRKALIQTAIELELLTEAEAQAFTKQGATPVLKERESSRWVSQDPYVELDAIQIEYRHAVYSLLAEGPAIVNPVADQFGYQQQERLSPTHMHQLKEERGLTDKQIADAGFFTLTADYAYLGILYLRLYQETGLPPNSLHIPGFWRLENGLIVDRMRLSDGRTYDFELFGGGSQYYWFFDPIDALGIPIRDTAGNIIAIQLRPDQEGKGGKYVWLSSTHATGQSGKIDGMSAGAPHDVTYPEKWTTNHVFVTEGKFKSLAIANTFRSPAISLQGVNTSRGLTDDLSALQAVHDKPIENVIVAFDADLSFNDAVLRTLIKMVETELTDYAVYIAVWDYKFGKGIDDVLQNGYGHTLVRITPDDLKGVRELLNKWHPTTDTNGNKRPIEVIQAERDNTFYNWLQHRHPEVVLHPSRPGMKQKQLA